MSTTQVRSRTGKRLDALAAGESPRAALVGYLPVGFPSVAGSARAARTMVEAGVPFVEAIDAIATARPKPCIEKPLHRLRSGIVGGQSISAAMRTTGELFPPLVADVVNPVKLF